jgi:hypothetical protein
MPDRIDTAELITRLTHAGVDSQTITDLISYLGQERCYAQREEAQRPTALGFAAQLDEHCDRAHGICLTMIGLREVLGGETCLAGTHQLTLDLADHAQRLKLAFKDLMLEG